MTLNSTIEKSIRRNRTTRDFDAYAVIDGVEQYLGSRKTALECETLIDAYITEQIKLASRKIPPHALRCE